MVGLCGTLSIAIYCISESEYDSGRQLQIILRRTEKTGGDVISLYPPGQKRKQMIVEPAAHSGCKGGVTPRAMGTHMPDTYQHFGKRSNLSNCHRQARTEERIVFVDFQIDRRARPRND